MEQLKTIGRELAMGSRGGFGQSKEFLDLVKAIGETRSKAEEDRIVLNEIEVLKRRLVEPDVPKRKMKEYIIRLLYVEMLGHDASFGYIHAVKMTHDDNLLVKRTGYLAVTLFLSDDHDLIFLIVNTIQKDLKSDNYLVVCAALNAVCKLINEDTIPAVLPQVVELLGHQKEAVKKKAIMALHIFYCKSPSSVSDLGANFRKRLCDNDPGVMGATLYPLFDLISEDVDSYKDLVISFVSILKQVAERRLPKSYDYHQMPAPFIQIKLLKILALLGSGDKHASESMYTVVEDLFKKCDSSTNIGNAVLYQCICCVSSIHPNPKLLEAAADVISKFLKSHSHNLKYMGVDGLGRLIKISPDIAEQHQLAVIDCLEDPDDTLKRQTFELLYKMTKSSNVEVIVDRMIDYMVSINDNHYKTEIVSRCVELAEQFAPSNQWFIQTMNRVFEHAGDLVNVKIGHNLMRLIAEGFGDDDDDADSKLRSSAVDSYLQIINEPKLPSVFLQVICWILGEYGTADGKYPASHITSKLCDVAEAYSNDEKVKAYAVTAIMKIYALEITSGRRVDVLPECQALVEQLLASNSTDLQQRACELQAILGLNAHSVECILPSDASCVDIEVTKNLPFLDNYVVQAIEKGAQPYIPESERSTIYPTDNFSNRDHREVSSHGLRFEAYELPKPSQPQTIIPVPLSTSSELVPVPEPSYFDETHHSTSISSVSEMESSSETTLRLDGVQKKWGRPTYSHASLTKSDSSAQKPAISSTSQINGVGAASSKPRNTYGLKKVAAEIDPEKQKLAASLFGRSSRTERRTTSSSHKATKEKSHAVERSIAMEKPKPVQPTPDLLDLGEPAVTNSELLADPFRQLEGLLDPNEDNSVVKNNHSERTDIMGLYSEGRTGTSAVSGIDGLFSGMPNPANKIGSGGSTPVQLEQITKGPNLGDAPEKDTLVRRMGVNLSSQSPIQFNDLLG